MKILVIGSGADVDHMAELIRNTCKHELRVDCPVCVEDTHACLEDIAVISHLRERKIDPSQVRGTITASLPPVECTPNTMFFKPPEKFEDPPSIDKSDLPPKGFDHTRYSRKKKRGKR